MVFRGDAAHYHVKAEGRHPALSQLVLQGSAAGGHSGSPVFKGDVTTWPVLLACGGEKVTLIEGRGAGAAEGTATAASEGVALEEGVEP